MTHQQGEHSQDEVGTYEIKLKGRLDEQWSDWLGGMHISHDARGNSWLSGPIPDQAALYGILMQLRDLGLTLVSLATQDEWEDTRVTHR